MKQLVFILVPLFLLGCNQPSPQSTPTDSPTGNQRVVPDTLGEEKSLRLARAKIQKLGIPTPERIDSLKSRSYRLFESENCSSAIDSLKTYSRKANWLANLISAGLEPYYSGSYDDRETISYSYTRKLATYEEKSNKLKGGRNEAYVMIAECSVRIGKAEQAAAYYFSALDLITPTDTELWDRARSGLYELLKVTPKS